MDFATAVMLMKQVVWPVFFLAAGGFVGSRIVGIILWYRGIFFKHELWLGRVEYVFRSMLIGIMVMIVFIHFFL